MAKLRFQYGSGGAIGDAGLSIQQKENLYLHLLDSGLDEIQKRKFLDQISIELHTAPLYFRTDLEGKASDAAKRLKTFSKAAKKLIEALDGMRADEATNQDPFQQMAIFFPNVIHSYVDLDVDAIWHRDALFGEIRFEDMMEKLQGTLDGLSKLSDYTQAMITKNVSQGSRPADSKARYVAQKVMEKFRDIKGRLPPYNRGSWFAGFMAELGNATTYSMGEKILAKEHKRLRKYT